MKLLLVAATLPEIQPFLSAYSIEGSSEEHYIGLHSVKVLVTGAGMVPTAYSLGRHFAKSSCDLAINAGIAGSFDFDIELGEVCLVKEDTFAELGAEDGDEFLSLDSLGLGLTSLSHRPNPAFRTNQLKEVSAITVNKVHGHELSIANAIARFNPQIESMEGAAFFYACNQAAVPYIQIRAISNYVERRNREKWDIELAVKNLNKTLINLLEE
ncbi:futalosine hydrolase [Daejeonella lutea]|uniref:Futalosine hydrolase n=1 Tax=Daejeonella lutea TaxID=572036 RepID=A0A1T5DW44_9SPHI|nr:futalosine hydrolase [Daejeonella lutea]SKB75776.1 futalosine hydrolase [Daejeonella lutea]